ncbi:MAG: hypothetical protein V2L15_09380 [Desulfobacteraceae bacterium]|jgi:hypothetical protein|nr:hypothetical protein [Desulfobacteraceae bacterium]
MGHYATYRPGTIDYTPQHDNIRALIQAMEERKICLVSYQNIMADKPKTFSRETVQAVFA